VKIATTVFGLCGFILAFQSAARAFSDPARFSIPASDGGGGGRFFTGAPGDGHSCGVCHRGGIAPQVTLRGLPESFEPGQEFTVTLQWAASAGSHALTLELADDLGRHPSVQLPPEVSLPVASRCDATLDGASAVYALDVGNRRILGVEDCGASQIAFSFTTPDVSTLYFAAGVVRSDSAGTADGDGVVEIRHTMRRSTGAQPASCTMSNNRDGVPSPFPWLGLGIVLGTLSVRARFNRNAGPTFRSIPAPRRSASQRKPDIEND
jgi:hypothetical protein